PELRAVVAESSFARLGDLVSHGLRHFFHLPSFPLAPLARWMIERQLHVDLATVAPLETVGLLSPRPLLLIDDELDEVLGPGQGQALFDAAGEPKELWVVPHAAHARGWQAAPQEYERRVVSFLRQHLG
ncbi:MAG: alpha/beta hydrolase, partial [Dehalococcoidia bacterium]